MLKQLLGKTQTRKPASSDPLDIMRYTRFKPRKIRTIQPMAAPEATTAGGQDCAMHSDAHSASRTSVPKAPVSVARPRQIQKSTEINLSEHLYSEAAISVALLRRSLPMRFRDVDARKQKTMAPFASPMKYAIG